MTTSIDSIRGGVASSGPRGVSSAPFTPKDREQNSAVRPLRIMHVFNRLDVGGTEKAVMKLVRGLEPGLFEHYICTMRGEGSATCEWEAGVPVLHAGREEAAFQFNFFRLGRVMREVHHVIVHSRN